MKLTAKQKIFVDEYLVDLNATRAYKIAYPGCKKDETANVNASRLLRNAKVKDYLEKRMKDREKRTEITQDRVLKELASIGFAVITDYVEVEDKGKYKDVIIKATKDIPSDKLAAIASIKQGANGIEVKLHDKVKALEDMGRHLGMFKDKVEHTGNITIDNPYEGLSTEELKKLAALGDDDG